MANLLENIYYDFHHKFVKRAFWTVNFGQALLQKSHFKSAPLLNVGQTTKLLNTISLKIENTKMKEPSLFWEVFENFCILFAVSQEKAFFFTFNGAIFNAVLGPKKIRNFPENYLG